MLTYRLGDDKKVLCQMLAKLYIPEVVDDVFIRRLKLYLDTVKMVRYPLSCSLTIQLSTI